ncbi:MAG: DUF349 domain-containing protein [Bulleidia sp.]
MKKPEFNDRLAKTRLRAQKSFDGKTVEILYGAKDEAGNPVEAREGVNDGHGRWFGIEVNGDYTMFVWEHSAEEGGETEYGTEYKEEALNVLRDSIESRRELCRKLEDMVNGDDFSEEAITSVRDEWTKLPDFNTPKEAELKERFEKAEAEFAPRIEARKEAAAKKEEIVARAEELRNAEKFVDARAQLRELRNELLSLGTAGAEIDKKCRSALNSIDRELRAKQQEYNANRDEAMKANKAKKEELVARAKEAVEGSKNFKQTTDQLEAIFREWKQTGRTNKEDDDALWKEFNGVRNAFRKEKEAFFNARKAQWAESIETKKKLIEEARAIVEKKDYGRAATDRMKALDKEWKAAGYSGRDTNNPLWDEFTEVKESFWSVKKNFAVSRISSELETKKKQLDSLKKKLEDAEYRIKIATNPGMKEDAEIEYRNRLREIDSLEAEIEDDEERLKK